MKISVKLNPLSIYLLIHEKKGSTVKIFGAFSSEKLAREFIKNNKEKDYRILFALIEQYYINPKTVEWIEK